MRTRILTLIVSLLATFTLQAQNLKGNDLKNYEAGLDFAERTDYATAIRYFHKVYKNNPENINVLYNLGLCYVNMSGNPDSALYFLKKVNAMDKSNWSEAKGELLIAMGRAYQLKFQFDEALRMYTIIRTNDSEGVFTDIVEDETEICNNAKILVDNPIDIKVKRLPDGINSECNDYRPVLSGDQQTLYFTSRRKSDNYDKDAPFTDGQYEEAIYTSRYLDGKWTKAERIKNLFPDKVGQESVTCVAKDNTELYLIRDYEIYVSHKDSLTGEWQQAEMLSYPINTGGRSHQKYAYVTEDGEQMYIVSDREGGFGGYDIYRSFRLPNGQWGVPKNLGPMINTDKDEDAPILHPTQNILYFSSAGHNTMGGMDIFYTPQRNDSTFEAVQNVGYPINTPDDDLYFVPTATKDKAYYASIAYGEDKLSSSFDIYEVEYKEPEINTLVVVQGSVNVVAGTYVSIIVEEDGEQIGRFRPNDKTNRFVLILEAGKEYEIIATDGRNQIRQTVEVSKKECYTETNTVKDIGVFDFIKKAEEVEAERQKQLAEQREADREHGIIYCNASSDDGGGDGGPEEKSEFDNPLDLTKPYVVQILSAKKKIDPNQLQGVDVEQVIEIVYKTDDWVVYSVGNFATYREAKLKQEEIVARTPYDDAFVRDAHQYLKWIQ